MPELGTKLISMSRSRKRWILVGYDISAMLLALWASFSVRLGELYVPENSTVVTAALLATALGVVALYLLGIYRIVLRFFNLDTISRILLGAAISATAWIVVVYFLQVTMTEGGKTIFVPRSIGLIYCGFLFTLLFVGRYFMASAVSGLAGRGLFEIAGKRETIAIYGANAAGVALSDSIQNHPNYDLCAFIEDDPALHGQLLAGRTIYPPEALPRLIEEMGIAEIFLAIPYASRAERLAVVSSLSDLNVNIKTIPAPHEIVSGRYTVSDIRPVHVNDLLRREGVEPLNELVQQTVDGCCILITGAGGSIGSEICRQIAQASPRKIVLLDHSEFALYTIEQEIRQFLDRRPTAQRPEVVPVIGSILNDRLLLDLIRGEQVESIYHAAAYKHVPLLECNEVAGVENNVFGTLKVASVALDEGLASFTLISTDKAVRPQNLMGCTKRLAELIVQSCAARTTQTRFAIVRFGNVLDSSGSVVQLFRSQILRGGPVTVTHRDVTRFFMSIPEATQLVLQASAMAESGEVFVLDMGEPVRIAELAHNMIRLSGMTVRDEDNPDGDIEISYTGMRPGEKLYEELFIGSDVIPTTHPRIRKAVERSLPFDEIQPYLARLRTAVAERDAETVRTVLLEVIEPDSASHAPEGATGGAHIAAGGEIAR